uniref:Annexin n=1 Tax=Rhabditophanes sp. KR3021 TaxID=114890 RepID=A0AC35TRV1_9BILA
MHTSRPSIVPHHDFDANKDAASLRKAFKGFGTDEGSVIRTLTQRSNFQRQQIAVAYKTLHGKDLIKDIKSELRGDFEDLMVSLTIPTAEYDAEQLYKAMSGLGTNESVLIEILCSRNNQQLHAIKQAYRTKYGHELERDIKSDTSGYFERILVALSVGNREDCHHLDQLKANQDARELYRAGEMKFGTDESTFLTILANRAYCQLALVFQEYEKVANHTIEFALRSEFSGDLLEALLAIVQIVRDTPTYFAERLHRAMQGLGTDDKTLIRIVVSRSEIDLKDIAMAYEKLYKKSLIDEVKGETSGDYESALVAIFKGN